MTTSPLAELRKVVATCTACSLCEERSQTVFGSGPADAPLMIIGEAPGMDEDRSGLPFVGRAGKLLSQLLEAARVPEDQVYKANILKCLYGETRVRLASGGSMTIRKMVKNRYTGEVVSVDDAGQLIAARVIGWHRSKLGDRKVFKLSHQYAKGNARGTVGAVLTGDHKVLTKEGFKRVDELTDSDLVATGEPAPRRNAEQIILGTMLGDGCVTKQLQLAHSVKQAAWLQIKAAALAGFGGKIGMAAQEHGDAITFYSKAGSYWRWLREKFYPNGEKVVPVDLIGSSLGPVGIAVWYCDDGYLRERENRWPAAEIAVNSFTKPEAEFLLSILASYGVEGRLRFGAGWRIKFNNENTNKLAKLIAAYVPPSMRYKLPVQFHDVPFDEETFTPERPQTFWATPLVEEHSIGDKTVYCIDVAGTHNFTTPGGVVHNCRPPKNRFPAGSEEPETCRGYLLKQIKEVNPQGIILTGKQALRYLLLHGTTEQWEPLTPWINKQYRRRHDFGDTRFLIVYHPSYLLRSNNEEDQEAWVQSVAQLWAYIEHKLAGTAPAPTVFKEIRVPPPPPRMGRNLFSTGHRGKVL